MRPVVPYPIAGTSCHARLPQIRVGVVRDQGESLLTPANDVVPYLEAQDQGRWDVTAFDERDFGGLLGAAADFDVIVIGYNATVFAPALRRALEVAPPTTPVLMLHQRDQECFAFLPAELSLRVVALGDAVTEARTPRERSDRFEPLLNWPHAGVARDARIGGKAIRGLSFSPDGAWRIVLEAFHGAQRVPVVIRSRSNHRQRLVACSLLLRPGADAAHGRLLENMLVYCAFGWPDVGLLEIGAGDEAGRTRRLAAGMAMWTERCVEVVAPTAGAVPLGAWPLRGVKRVVATDALAREDFEQLDGADEWLRAGGELVRLSDGAGVTVHSRAIDRLVVLREWAMWFGALEEDAWLSRLSPARAVLSVLDALRDDAREVLETLRFEARPEEHADAVRRLLARRVRGRNVDETISATAMALDLHRLTGGTALSPFRRRRVEGWLRQEMKGASRVDALEILRCLGDGRRLRSFLLAWGDGPLDGGPGARLDALVATRLRDAVRACWPDGGEPADLLPAATLEALDGPEVVDDLRGRPLLCAEFLAVLHRHTKGAQSELFDAERFPRSVAVAVDHIRATGLYSGTPDVRAVCAHTLAMLGHLERHPAGLRLLPGRADLPASAAESVLQEATRARANEREARRDLPQLGRAVLLLGTLALGSAILGLLELWSLFGVAVSVRPWWVVLPALAVPGAVLMAVRWAYRRGGIREERRDLRLGQTAAGVLAVALAAVAATLSWPLAAPDGRASPGALGLALLVFTTAFVVQLPALRHLGLAPGWAQLVPALFSELKSPLAYVSERLKGPPRDAAAPPGDR